jgi:hypothetical protein
VVGHDELTGLQEPSGGENGDEESLPEREEYYTLDAKELGNGAGVDSNKHDQAVVGRYELTGTNRNGRRSSCVQAQNIPREYRDMQTLCQEIIIELTGL